MPRTKPQLLKIKTTQGKSLYAVAIGISILLLFLVISRAWHGSKSKTTRVMSAETVVVSAHSDPYFSLAQQIAREENLRIIEEFPDILQFNPKYIILVAAPRNLSIEKLASIGNIFKSQDYYPALGIISGSSLQAAEQLWERRNSARAGNNFVGGDVEVLQSVDQPTIFNISAGANTKIALDKNSLIETLKQADYFYWTRHSGGKSWYWNDGLENSGFNDELLAHEIPHLKPVVIYSPTCSIFRPWLMSSIALSFIDKGAAAFLGFVNSPHTTAFSKYGLSVPGLSSWSEFPLGLVAQVQNKTTTKMIYSSPQLFMFGDPRIYLSKDPPYQIISDQTAKNGKRVIEGYSDTQGVLAVRIPNAAKDHFLSIQGLTALSDHDIFYNRKVQTLDLGLDKYLLILHQGGSFQIELSPQAPFGWVFADAFLDALDYSWAVLWVDVYADANPSIYLISVPIFIGILLFKIFIQKKSIRSYQKIFIAAFSIALFRLGYGLLRLDGSTVSAILIDHSAKDMLIGFAGVFSGVAGGLMIMKDSRKIAVKALGLLFAVARQFWMAGYYLAFLTFMNNVPQITSMTAAGVWNYTVFWLSLIPLVLEILMILAADRYGTSGKNLLDSAVKLADEGLAH